MLSREKILELIKILKDFYPAEDQAYQVEISRIFICHSNNGKKIASELKENLDTLGLSVFVAHIDIIPSKDFPSTIIQSLKSIDIFIPIITDDFRKSDWADQECGMAFLLEKLILPISIDNNLPYGFLSQLQAFKVKSEDLPIARWDMMNHLINVNPKLQESLLDTIVKSFQSSPDFTATGSKFRALALFDLKIEHLITILEASIHNSQIYNYYNTIDSIHGLLYRTKRLMSKEVLEKIEKKIPKLFDNKF